MPDTFSHIILTGLFGRYYRQPLFTPLVLIGAILPDYLREFFAFVLPAQNYHATIVFHSLLGIFVSSMLFTAIFERSFRFVVLISIMSGQLIHLMLDLLQFYHCGGQFHLFSPFWQPFQIGLIPESDWIYLAAISMLLLFTYGLILLRRRHLNFRQSKTK